MERCCALSAIWHSVGAAIARLPKIASIQIFYVVHGSQGISDIRQVNHKIHCALGNVLAGHRERVIAIITVKGLVIIGFPVNLAQVCDCRAVPVGRQAAQTPAELAPGEGKSGLLPHYHRRAAYRYS